MTILSIFLALIMKHRATKDGIGNNTHWQKVKKNHNFFHQLLLTNARFN